jgi:hypothetical protein
MAEHWSSNASVDSERRTVWTCHDRVDRNQVLASYPGLTVRGCDTCHETWVQPE